jgi:hypothetical protein
MIAIVRPVTIINRPSSNSASSSGFELNVRGCLAVGSSNNA